MGFCSIKIPSWLRDKYIAAVNFLVFVEDQVGLFLSCDGLAGADF